MWRVYPTTPALVNLAPLLLLSLLLTTLCANNLAEAGGFCDSYNSSDSSVSGVVCGKGGAASTKPAGANSTFTDAFNLTSAGLPTEPSSYGLEWIQSGLRSDPTNEAPTFSLIKGFHRFGTGISTGGNNTFFGNDVFTRIFKAPEVTTFRPQEKPRGGLTNLNLGTSFQLKEAQSGPNLRLGLSARYNRITNTWGGGPALLAAWKKVTLGAGFTKEKVSNDLPATTFTTLTASARVSSLEFEYTLLNDSLKFGLTPIRILSVSAVYKRLTLTGAMRTLNYLKFGVVTQFNSSAQYLFSQSFSAGLLYNYIPGATSFGFQFYL